MYQNEIIFKNLREHQWIFGESTDRYDLKLFIYRNRYDENEWICNIDIYNKEPTEPCQHPDECDTGHAELSPDGKMICCDYCPEKNFVAICTSVETTQDMLVSKAKKELARFCGHQGIEGVDHIVNGKWVFGKN